MKFFSFEAALSCVIGRQRRGQRQLNKRRLSVLQFCVASRDLSGRWIGGSYTRKPYPLVLLCVCNRSTNCLRAFFCPRAVAPSSFGAERSRPSEISFSSEVSMRNKDERSEVVATANNYSRCKAMLSHRETLRKNNLKKSTVLNEYYFCLGHCYS